MEAPCLGSRTLWEFSVSGLQPHCPVSFPEFVPADRLKTHMSMLTCPCEVRKPTRFAAAWDKAGLQRVQAQRTVQLMEVVFQEL